MNTLPVKPKDRPTIVPSTRWRIKEGALMKTYEFLEQRQRDVFVSGLLKYESSVNHHGMISIFKNDVSLTLITIDRGVATDLDKEYAAHADVLYKDVTYSDAL